MMVPFQIKICGITKAEDALFAAQNGADAIGLNFYPKSARSVDLDKAVEIAKQIEFLDSASSGKSRILKVGVFVNEPISKIVQCQQAVGLDGIQLHGDETPDQLVELISKLENPNDVILVRAIRSRPKSDSPEDVSAEISSVKKQIKYWTEAGCRAVLLDAKIPGEFGGTGHKVDWQMVPRILEEDNPPIILAGGLDPWNVAEAIQTTGVRAVDVASGVESIPGVKDHDRISKFVTAARKAFEAHAPSE